MYHFPKEIIAWRSAVGDAVAQHDLGIMFLKNNNYKAAQYWLMRSFQGGYQKALEELDKYKERFSTLEEN